MTAPNIQRRADEASGKFFFECELKFDEMDPLCANRGVDAKAEFGNQNIPADNNWLVDLNKTLGWIVSVGEKNYDVFFELDAQGDLVGYYADEKGIMEICRLAAETKTEGEGTGTTAWAILTYDKLQGSLSS